MYSRLLLDPVASTEGVTPTPAPAVAPPVPAPTPAATPAPEPKPTRIEVDATDLAAHYQELETLRRFKADAETQRRTELDKAEQERLKAIAEKEGAEKALAEQRTSWETRLNEANQRYQTQENSLLSSEKGRVIADQLAGITFVNDFAREMVVKHLNDTIDVSRDAAGKIVVRDRTTGQFAGEAIKATLAGAEFSPFIKAGTTTGGANTNGANLRAETPAEPSDPQDAMFEAIKQSMGRDTYVGLASRAASRN